MAVQIVDTVPSTSALNLITSTTTIQVVPERVIRPVETEVDTDRGLELDVVDGNWGPMTILSASVISGLSAWRSRFRRDRA